MSIRNNSSKLAKNAATQAAIDEFLNNGGSIAQGYKKAETRKPLVTEEGTFYYFGKAEVDRNLTEQIAQLAPDDFAGRLDLLVQVSNKHR